MKNHSELIKSKVQRTLTAKGVKFVWRCIDVVAMQHNVHKYSKEIKPVKDKLRDILYHLIIDKEMTREEIKDAIKNRSVKLPLN